MRVLLVTLSPKRAFSEPDSPGAALRDLGCDVLVVGLDLDIDEESLAKRPPVALIIDTRDRVEAGYACLKRLREIPILQQTPSLLAVTADRLSSITRDAGGADDFVLVPVVPAELYARVRQLDWRLSAFRGEDGIKVGDLHVDPAAYEARLRDRALVLTHQEFELLRFFVERPGKVFTREQLLTKVWGYRYEGGTRTVDIHVRRIRQKLGAPADQMIETIRNVGYKLRA